MKKIISIIGTLLIAGVVMAQPDGTSFTIVSKTGTLSSAVSPKVSGFLDSIYLGIASGSTGWYSAKITSTDEIIYTNSAVVSNAVTVRPRIQANTTNGIHIGYTTNSYERVYLVEESITFSQLEIGPITNTATIKLRLQKE